MKNILIIQPWFTAKGHPAQSLLNTARVLAPYKNISYLISSENGGNQFLKVTQELSQLATLNSFPVKSASLREGTIKALNYLFRNRKSLQGATIFFLDAHLVIFAFCWPLLQFWLHSPRIGFLYLKGPERIYSYWITRKFVIWLLSSKKIVLYLRTEELEADWKKYFPQIDSDKIRTIPSLELSNEFDSFPYKEEIQDVTTRDIKFGVIGQVRRGKGLEWLVPLFEKNITIGKLTVAGTFFDKSEEDSLPQLRDFEGFRNEFLSEVDMLTCAAHQDYLLMLYDDWDARMESAVLYLAAKVRRPVIAYDKGWCGRKVAMFGCGLLVSDDDIDFDMFLSEIPRPGSKEYSELLEGMEQFSQAHSGNVARTEFLRVLLE